MSRMRYVAKLYLTHQHFWSLHTNANLNFQVCTLQLRLHPSSLYGFSSLKKMF